MRDVQIMRFKSGSEHLIEFDDAGVLIGGIGPIPAICSRFGIRDTRDPEVMLMLLDNYAHERGVDFYNDWLDKNNDKKSKVRLTFRPIYEG